MKMAAADLLHQFGHPIRCRLERRCAKQERQKPVRDALEVLCDCSVVLKDPKQ